IFTLTGEFAMDLSDTPSWLSGDQSVAGTGRPSPAGSTTNPTLDSFRQLTTFVSRALRTKSLEQLQRSLEQPEHGSPGLKRVLTALDLTMFGVGAIIG